VAVQKGRTGQREEQHGRASQPAPDVDGTTGHDLGPTRVATLE
jgi:hypothetical protein